MDVSPSLGLSLGLPLAIVGILALVAVAYYLLRVSPAYDARGWGICILACALALVVLTGWRMWPWEYEYHSWRNETGQIAEISSRLIGSSSSLQQKFVVRFTDGRERGCEDTRCSLLREGDTLTLRCKRSWQFAGTDGWDCAYVSSKGRT